MPQAPYFKVDRPRPPLAAPRADDDPLPAYAELHCRSNFSFLVGASHPQELVARAAQLGYAAIAITDECSVAGVVRAHEEARRQAEAGNPLKLIIGSELTLDGDGHGPGCRLVLLAHDREGYANLCDLITRARLRSEKGRYRATMADVQDGMPHCTALLIPIRDDPPDTLLAQARWLHATFGERAAVAVEPLLYADDTLLVERLDEIARRTGLPLAAAGDVLMHLRSRKAAQDALTAIRLKTPVAECGYALARNAEQHLRSRLRLAQLHRPEWLAAGLAIAARCTFSLDELRYEYPAELVPAGYTPLSWLTVLTERGASERYPQGVPASVRAQVERELALVQELRYEAFFLTVHDVVRFARAKGILCQGRGSAANSAVCYCLGITEVDPTQTTLLFERFISRERNEPPDIDVDFEHERREEVIQYIYAKYGIERCALAAALATYRTRGAVRDVGKALGLDEGPIDAVARSMHWFDDTDRLQRGLVEAGLDPASLVVRQWMDLVATLHGFPRHLSQHVGGFVIARDKLSRLVPIENAAMDNRRVIQWDKDDLESLGLLKVDVLALGMLSCIRRALAFMTLWHGRPWRMQDIPREDPATYEMCCRADTVGVFQIESRAQMSMLPRLKPRRFYDLVIEVAIVRPGPIQGGMVHPYLQRRDALAAGTLAPSKYPALNAALERTLGVPLFQEQVMQICTIAAGFTPGEADGLRRAMAAWRRDGHVDQFEARIKQGMAARGYDAEFADGIFRQICGFGEYGFPESHAYSFALLAYVSAWMKCHESAIFVAALLNSQPMGFYAPSQLVQDARRHGVEVRPVDVCASDWDCTLERRTDGGAQPAVRLGLRQVGGFAQTSAERVMCARRMSGFTSVDDLARRARLDAQDLQSLARADALQSLAGHRRRQLWAAAGQGRPEKALLADAPIVEQAHEQPDLFEAPEGEAIAIDYAATGLSLRRHPLALLRGKLTRRGWKSSEQLAQLPDGAHAWACGIVTMRQQPETAKGVIFVTLEDETGSVNVIVWRHVRERQRPALLRSRLLAVAGQWQAKDGTTHLIARRLVDVTPWLGAVATSSRDFH
ncbi:MAG: error-prone DNA polymerase [Aquincola sp.]|nr:error-prone DNA polymerase [Aquincola sp.]MDH4288060.1 error-prone DNA polymerase [Aquincola sp.]